LERQWDEANESAGTGIRGQLQEVQLNTAVNGARTDGVAGEAGGIVDIREVLAPGVTIASIQTFVKRHGEFPLWTEKGEQISPFALI